MSRLVTPLIAETTTTTGFWRADFATIWATRAMQEASPTECAAELHDLQK